MMDQLVLRYALPGLPLAIILFLLERVPDGPSRGLLSEVAILIALAVLSGNIIQQSWMLFFEQSRHAYNSPDRAVLKAVRKKLAEAAEHISSEALYEEWESFFYSDSFPKGFREKDRGHWHFYHGNAANALGLLLAGAIATIAALFMDGEWLLFFAVPFLLAALALGLKARQTRILVESLEKFWIKEYWDLLHVRRDRNA